MRALNMGRPSIEDIKGYSQHIAQNTYLWTDGLQSYSALSTEKQCTIKQMMVLCQGLLRKVCKFGNVTNHV